MLNAKLAFRNLFRNTRRTFLTMSAMSAATFLLMITLSINDGFLWSMILSSTDYFHAHIKITSQKYEDKKDLHHTVSDTIDKAFINYSKLKGISPRISSNLLFSHQKGDKSWSVPAELLGVSPTTEASVTKLHESVVQGSFLNESPKQKLILGKLLAKSLRAKVGDEIIVMGQGAYGAIASGLFIVSGIISTSDNLRDSRLALAHIKDVQEILGLYNQAHYYTASIYRVLEAKQVAIELQGLSKEYHVDSWRDILEQVSQALDFWIISQVIILCIFYFAVILICANTMTMSIMERKYEFATLRAIGITRLSILKILTLEGVFLSSCAAIIGGIIGLSISFILYYYPIDLSSYFGPLAWGGSSFQPLIRAYPSYFNMLLPVCVMMILGVVTTIYPTIKLLATPLNQVMGDR